MTIEQEFDFSMVPPAWQLCFCEGCPRHAECLRYLAGQRVPEGTVWGPAVYPTAYRTGSCPLFKEIRVIRAAYGFAPLFREVKQKDYTPLREMMKQYLGSHNTYYRYNRGERMLTPEQQEWILDLFRRHGYTEGLAFEHYQNILDFS